MFQVSLLLSQNLVLFDVIKCVPMATLNALQGLIYSTAHRQVICMTVWSAALRRSQSDRSSLAGALSLVQFLPKCDIYQDDFEHPSETAFPPPASEPHCLLSHDLTLSEMIFLVSCLLPLECVLPSIFLVSSE